MTNPNFPLAALSFPLTLSGVDGSDAASVIQLTPDGVFRASDGSGRPADAAAWKVDAAVAEALVAAFSRTKNPRVIDYEHQTLLSAKNGAPAPAAGWFDGLEYRAGEGLFATGVRWTERAAAMLKAGEYRFISPVFSYTPGDGAVRDIRMAALTNNPGLDGMRQAALSASLNEDLSGAPRAGTDLPTQPEENPVELKTLLAALDLPETETEAKALEAVAALKAEAKAKTEEIAALKGAAHGDFSGHGSKGAPSAGHAAPDPAKYVPLETALALQSEIAALKAGAEAVTAEGLIEEAKAAGKMISEPLEAHLKTLPTARLSALLSGMTPVAALIGTQSGATRTETLKAAPPESAAGAAVMKAMGLSPEVFANGKEKP